MSRRALVLIALVVAMPLLMWWSPKAYGIVVTGVCVLGLYAVPAAIIVWALRRRVDLRKARLAWALLLGNATYGAIAYAAYLALGERFFEGGFSLPAHLASGGLATLTLAFLVELARAAPRRLPRTPA